VKKAISVSKLLISKEAFSLRPTVPVDRQCWATLARSAKLPTGLYISEMILSCIQGAQCAVTSLVCIKYGKEIVKENSTKAVGQKEIVFIQQGCEQSSATNYGLPVMT